MKTFLTIIILALAVILIASCTSKQPITTEVYALQDVTDSKMIKPNVNEIIPLYNYENIYNGGIFRLTKMTDVTYNPTTKTKIEPANQWLSNELERKKEISKFKDQVSEILTNADKDSLGRVNSSVYLPIATTLNKLSESQMHRRILLVYSDLMENTIDMSFYRKENYALLLSNPGKVQSYFEKLEKLNSLTGIEIYLIYQPINNLDDQQYRLVSVFYKTLLENKGAKVIISASINH